MKRMMATLLVFSLAFHYPSLSAEELGSYVYDRHSSLPISEVSTFWFIANTQTGTMAYTYPCQSNCSRNACIDDSVISCADTRIVSLMPDINVVIYIDGLTSYWIDTRTGCHYLLLNNQPRIDELGKIVCDSDLRI